MTVHYLRTGVAAEPVSLLHGLTGNGACWTPLARLLEGEFDVVMPDARGHGRSSMPKHGYGYEDHASDVIAIEIPILLVIGDRSPVVTLEMAEDLRRLNSRVQLERIEDAGHGLPYDQPERLGEVVATFLRERR